MEKYAPTIKDLAARDVVSRPSTRKFGGPGHRRPGFRASGPHSSGQGTAGRKALRNHFLCAHLSRHRCGDPAIPVQPTCHYMMGGIPTNVDGQVLDHNLEPVAGLYAAGECACVSVHGANRLGCNSLLDLVVFGRRAGKSMARELEGCPGTRFLRLRYKGAGPDRNAQSPKRRGEGLGIAQFLQETMTLDCSVFRTGPGLAKALATVRRLRERYADVAIQNRGTRFNTDLLEALELEALLTLAETIAARPWRGGKPRRPFTRRFPRAK